MPTKSSSALATRSLESFAVFNDKRFVAGYQPLVTIQPLNKSKKRGWFIRNSDLDNCGWTAEVTDFDKGSVSFDYEQTFGMPPNTSKELGINFHRPRVQVLLRSPLMVEETSGMRQILGSFENDRVKELWDADKIAADLAQSKGEMYKRKFSVRTKYLIYILTQENKRAHKLPVVLTLKGLNGTDVSSSLKEFESDMSKCFSKAIGSEVPLMMNEQFYCTTIWTPSLVSDMRGQNNVEICCVDEYEKPIFNTQEAAAFSLDQFSIPDEDRESTWKFQEMYNDYINQHSKQDASRLNGAYGIAEGVNILPESRGGNPNETVEVKVLNQRDNLGADSML